MRIPIRHWPFATAVAFLLAACGSDVTGLADVAGQYTATVFKFVNGADTTDALTAGASLTITLAADGTTTGQLFAPATLNNGTPFTASMEGTFTLANGVISFNQAADSFVRDMPFTVAGNALSANKQFDSTSGGTTIIIVLTRQ